MMLMKGACKNRYGIILSKEAYYYTLLEYSKCISPLAILVDLYSQNSA